MRKMATVQEAIKYVETKYNKPNYILMPVGSLTVPSMSKE
jgi:hypothetical protein